jgi:uncharacterized membrane protein YfcA
MEKYLSREFLLALALMVIATVALFTMGKVGFVEWAAACGGFVGIYTGGKTLQKIKLNK